MAKSTWHFAMNLLVVGSRCFDDEVLLEDKLDYFMTGWELGDVRLISGGAPGADTLAAEYGHNYKMEVKVFPADWAGQGKKAGYLRNLEMGKLADMAIAFWDGKSKGTQHMIRIMVALKKEVLIVAF